MVLYEPFSIFNNHLLITVEIKYIFKNDKENKKNSTYRKINVFFFIINYLYNNTFLIITYINNTFFEILYSKTAFRASRMHLKHAIFYN